MIALRTAQTSSNGWGVDDSGASYTLDSTGAGAVMAPAIAQSNRGRADNVAETLRSDSHGALPMVLPGADRVANTISAHHGRNSGEDTFVAATLGASFGRNRGLGQENETETIIAVSVSENQRGELRTSGIAAQLTHGGGKPGQGYPAVLAFTERGLDVGTRIDSQADLAYPLQPPHGGRTHREIAGDFGVRRLTPVECERLQGFPDNYTARGADGPQSDSARYRQLGNAVCVRVSAWLGRQIVRYLP